MSPQSPRRRRIALGAAALLLGSLAIPLSAASAAGAEPDLPGSTLFVNPFSTTLGAAQSLTGQARDDAQLLGSIPSAEWFTKGTAAEVEAAADLYVDRATEAGAMPVLVAYNLPFRDCAQYSAGGATSTAEYEAWIDGLAAGIGNRPATVILEPDGLGIIPWYTTFENTSEWCKPAEADPATAATDRFEQLNYAVDALGGLAETSVYLDGTHSGWLNVGDITDRLLAGGRAARRWLLPQRVELQLHDQPHVLRHVDLVMHRAGHREGRGARQLPQPVLERLGRQQLVGRRPLELRRVEHRQRRSRPGRHRPFAALRGGARARPFRRRTS